MLINASLRCILNCKINSSKYHFVSFKSIAHTFNLIKLDSSYRNKKSILNTYYQSLQQNQKLQFISLCLYLHDKPKTNVSHLTLLQVILGSNRITNPNNQIHNIEQAFKCDWTTNSTHNFTLKDCLQFLQFLKNTSGTGSKLLKIKKINSLIMNLSQEQAEYLTRIILNDLNIGLSKQSFRQFMNTYQESKPTSILKDFMPMLAKPLQNIQEVSKFCVKHKKILADAKYDGERTIIHYNRETNKLEMQSRNGKSQLANYQKLSIQVQAELRDTNFNEIILDCQIVKIHSENKTPLPMQNLRNMEQQGQLILYCFDVIQIDGKSQIDQPLSNRKQLIPDLNCIRRSEYNIFVFQDGQTDQRSQQAVKKSNEKEIMKLLKYLQLMLASKYEGLILKGQNDKYNTSGSRAHWGKLKRGFQTGNNYQGKYDFDLVVMGAYFGKGKNNSLLSSFLVGTIFKGKIYPVSKVGSGFTQEELEALNVQLIKSKIETPPQEYYLEKVVKVDCWFKPQYVFEVICQQLTRSPVYTFGSGQEQGGVSLRFPIFKRLRTDKEWWEATTGDSILQLLKDH